MPCLLSIKTLIPQMEYRKKGRNGRYQNYWLANLHNEEAEGNSNERLYHKDIPRIFALLHVLIKIIFQHAG